MTPGTSTTMPVLAVTPLLLLAAPLAAATIGSVESRGASNEPIVLEPTRDAKSTANSDRLLGERGDGVREVDLSEHCVKFERCHSIESYDDKLAGKSKSETVLGTKRFVTYRLCPPDDFGPCDSDYGEYLIDLEGYLEITADRVQQAQVEMCESCKDKCPDYGRTGGRRRVDLLPCDCVDTCAMIETMEENGYVDATEFLRCEMIYGGEDDGGGDLYAGPVCASSGAKIKIGVFTDEYCNNLDTSKDVEDYLVDGNGDSMKLSYFLLKETYNARECKMCSDDEEKEMCENLYEYSAECKESGGSDGGDADHDNNENQLAHEEEVCAFLHSVSTGTYNEKGEVVVTGGSVNANDPGHQVSSMSRGQKTVIAVFAIGTAVLLVCAVVLLAKLSRANRIGLYSHVESSSESKDVQTEPSE